MRRPFQISRRGNAGSESGATARRSQTGGVFVAPHSDAESLGRVAPHSDAEFLGFVAPHSDAEGLGFVAPHSDAESFRGLRSFSSIRGLLLFICISWFTSQAAVSPHPNIMWEGGGAFEAYNIEIATDAEFSNVVDRDTMDHISRYVPAQPLEPGTYFWRATDRSGLAGQGSFVVEEPRLELRIPAGSGMAEIRDALEEARESTSTRILFEPGEYHLHPGNEGTVFEIRDHVNLIVDGNGAKFIIHDIARLVEVRGGTNLTFRNFTVDYEAPIYTAAKVESVSEDGTMELTLWPGCVPPETVPRFMEEQRGLFYDPEFPRMAENVPLLVHMSEEWEPLGDDRYRLQAAQPDEVQNVRPGMVYICAPRYVPQGIELYNCDDVTFADITTYYLPGIGVVTAFSHDLKLIRFNILRRDDRLLAVQNGGTNIHNGRVGPWIEDCRFENTGDDCNHISALVLSPIAHPKPDRVLLARRQPGTRGLTAADLDVLPEDRLAFFDRPSGTLVAEARVIHSEVMGPHLSVTVDRELPDLSLCDGEGGFPAIERTQIYNLDRACGNFAFRNNTFYRGRRIGILAKSGPGLIENNRFEELGAGGVELWNAPFEGLHAHEILIQNNLFRRGGLVYHRQGPGNAIWTQIFSGRTPQPLHRDIRIIGNRIEDYPGIAMKILDVTGVRIEGNLFSNKELDELRDPRAALITLHRTENAVVQNNRFEDDRFPESRWIRGERIKNHSAQ